MDLLVLAALLAIQILFGVNYVVSKVVVGHFPPLVWASIRIIVSSIIMLAIALASRRKAPKLDKSFLVPLIFYALLGTIINQSTFLVGLRYTTSTNSSILNTLIPVFTLLVVTIRGQEPLTMPRGFGFALAFIGVLIIRNVESFTFANQTFIGDILTVINCLSYALFLSYSKKFLEKHDSLWSTTWLFIYGSVGLTLLAAPDWTQFHWTPPSANMWAAMVFAILGATLATYFLSFWALAHAKASKIAMFIFLQPVVTSIVAVIWLGEVITLRKVLASLLIFLGFYLAIFERKQPLINS